MKNTNVLETIFYNSKNSFKVLDYFPRCVKSNIVRSFNEFHRVVENLRGRSKIKVLFDPKFNYALGESKISLNSGILVAEAY